MPYIPRDVRTRIHDSLLKKGVEWTPADAGEMNYTMTKFMDNYLLSQGGVRYTHINDLIGALEMAKPAGQATHETGIRRETTLTYAGYAPELREKGLDWVAPSMEALHAFVSYMLARSDLTVIQRAGVLTCCQMELYRLLGAPYEEVKMAENGDVYTVDPEGGTAY